MPDLQGIKKEIARMAASSLKMLQTTFAAFMEHDRDLVAAALEEEKRINDLEKEITTQLVEFARNTPSKREHAEALILAEVAGDLELIGDYCKDILERIEIKIEERLLFNEETVKEYTELYRRTEDAFEEVCRAIEKDDPSAVGTVLKKEEHIDGLVDVFRRRHNERMIAGACTPMSCNMLMNILDYTAAVYYHVKKIARNLLKMPNA